MKWKNSLTISLLNFGYLPHKDGKKVDAKNEDKEKKIWKNEFEFEFPVSKLSYITTFMKIWNEKNLTHFLKHFSPIKVKIKM